MLQDINLQPDTQPLDDSFEMEEKVHIEGAWGQLYPSGTFPRLALKQEMFWTGGPRLATMSSWSLTWAVASDQTR